MLENIDSRIREIKDRMKAVRTEENKIKEKFSSLEQEFNTATNEKLSPLIGLCFEDEKKIFIISNLPQPSTKYYVINYNQLPVYIFDKASKEFCDDTIFSKVCDKETTDIVKAFCDEGYEKVSISYFYSVVIGGIAKRIETIEDIRRSFNGEN